MIVRAPGLDEQGAFWGGKVDICKSSLIPGQDAYERRDMAKHLGKHGVPDTTKYATVKIFLVSLKHLYTSFVHRR